MAVVDELVTILGVKIAADALTKIKQFSDGVAGVAKAAEGFGQLVIGAATTAGMFIKSVVDEASALDTLSQTTGISTTALQEWQYAAKAAGVDAKAVQGDLVSLQKTMSSPIPGQFNTTLAMFGVSARDSSGKLKTTDQLLGDMADKLKGMSAQRASQWAAKLGISNDTLQLLRQGKIGLEELREEAHKLGGIIPESSIKIATQFKKSLAELQFAIRGITSQVAIATLPALSKLIDGFKEFISYNREFISLGLSALMDGIVGGFDRFFGMLKNVGNFFKPLIDNIKKFLPEMSGAEVVTHLVTGALTGLVIVFAPVIAAIVATAAKLVLLSVAFEDLFAFINGEGSVIGDWFEIFKSNWPDLFGALAQLTSWFADNIEPALDSVWEIAKYVGSAFADIGVKILDMLNSVAGPIADFFNSFSEKYPTLTKILKELARILGTTLKGAFDLVISVIKGVIDLIGNLLGVVGRAIEKLAEFLEWLFASESESDKVKKGHADTAAAVGVTNERFASMPQPGLPSSQAAAQSARGTQINDNKTINQQIYTSDPQQAANAAIAGIGGNTTTNIVAPGMYAPRAM